MVIEFIPASFSQHTQVKDKFVVIRCELRLLLVRADVLLQEDGGQPLFLYKNVWPKNCQWHASCDFFRFSVFSDLPVTKEKWLPKQYFRNQEILENTEWSLCISDDCASDFGRV